MNQEEIINRTKIVIAKSLMKPIDQIHSVSSLLFELGADSLDLLDIVFALETEFGVQLKGTELDSVLKVDFLQNLNQGLYLNNADATKFIKIMPQLKDLNQNEITPKNIFQAINIDLIVRVLSDKINNS